MADTILHLVADILISTIMLWIGAKLTSVNITIFQLFKVVCITSLIMLIPIPYLNWIAAVIVGLLLIMSYTDESPAGVILMIVIGKVASIALLFFAVSFMQ